MWRAQCFGVGVFALYRSECLTNPTEGIRLLTYAFQCSFLRAHRFNFRQKVYFWDRPAPLDARTSAATRVSQKLEHSSLSKGASSNVLTRTMLSQPEFSILCDIHHFQKAHLQKYFRAQCFPNSSSQFSVTFVTFENVSIKMYTQFYIIDTLMSNSLWHSSLLKNVGCGFTYATNVLSPTPILKQCGRKYFVLST